MHKLREVSAIASSQFVRDQMVRSGYRSDSIRILRHPAPNVREHFPLEQGDVPHFVFLGRITPEKGLIWLLRALAEVKVPFHMDIAGSGNQEQTIHHLAERLELVKRVTFHGWVKEEQAIQLIQKARALVFPSVWHEPAGLISLEAAAAGRAIIASEVGGIPEYASRLQNALLVPPNDVHGLARSIEQLATDWSLAKLMGVEGRKMAEKHFLLEKHTQELMRLYELAIKSRSA
jgi:glycosyltransferase involved in cell wall biosynthesis